MGNAGYTDRRQAMTVSAEEEQAVAQRTWELIVWGIAEKNKHCGLDTIDAEVAVRCHRALGNP